MNKRELYPSSLPHPVDIRSDLPSPRHTSAYMDSEQQHRLVVLIPAEVDCSAMTSQIWELAQSTPRTSVQLFSLAKNVVEEPGLRRSLATMCALIQEGGVTAQAKVEIGVNWIDVIRRNYQEGDLIVCFGEQRAGLLHRPLSQILQSNLDIQVYILSSLNAQDLSQSNWFAQIMAWIGSVGIIVVSFLLQIRITSLPQDWAQTTLMILSVLGEIWLIWIWNNLFN